MKKGTKILSLVAAMTLFGSTAALVGCGKKTGYRGQETSDEYTEAMENGGEVSSNGGFVVEKGGYVYFINGIESTTADNGYGTPVKGSLMCIKKDDLANGNYAKAKIVIPSLFTAQDFTSGLYIFGDYVYYATPTTDKNVSGETGNSNIDFKRARLDGTEAPMSGFYFRADSATTYRYVQVAGVDRNNDGKDDVFCLYEEGTTLKSYNTATNEDVVLVKGASDYFYDTKDLTNPNVYYTMSVTYDAEKNNPTKVDYNQIYCVNAAAQVKSVNADQASYTVVDKDGNEVRTYDFSEGDMKKNAGDRGYKLDDYTTYPYVNLGELVLDGVGFSSKHTHYNEESAEDIKDATEPQGYTYAIKRYETSGSHVGLYFTRKAVMGTPTEKTYYVEERKALADGWNTVAANDNEVDLVVNTASDIPDTAIMEVGEVDGNLAYTYLYTKTINSNTVIKKVTTSQGNVLSDIAMTYDASGATLWKTNGDYLYYYTSGTNGKKLNRINYTGVEDDYNPLRSEEEYEPMQIPFVEYNSSWYQPEFVSVLVGDVLVDVLLYANAQTYGTSSSKYNYVYAAKVGTTEELSKANKAYEKYTDYLAEYESGDNADGDVAQLIEYLFGCELEVTEEAKAEYIKKFNKGNNDADSKKGEEFYQSILDKFDSSKADYILSATAYTNCISRVTESDKEAMDEAWDGLLLYPEKEESTAADEGLETWAICLIVIGCVVVVAAAVGVPVILHVRKKKAAKREADAIVNSYKRQRIDTTDDKTIDVYADETNKDAAEEEAEESVEETPAEESVVEPVAEAAEETPAENAENEAESDSKEKIE